MLKDDFGLTAIEAMVMMVIVEFLAGLLRMERIKIL